MTEINYGGLSKDQILEKLKDANIYFNEYAHKIFNHQQFVIDKDIKKVQLVKLKLEDVGLTNPCSYKELVDKAASLDLVECPIDLAAYLRLELLNQIEGPYLTIASQKLESDPDFPNGLYLRNNEGKLWLRGYRADDFCEWPKDNEFIFIKM